MSKKMLETKDLVPVKKGTAGKKTVKFVAFIIVVNVVVNVIGKLVNKMNENDMDSEKDGDILKYSVVFDGRNIKIENEPFKGAMIKSVFGGIKLDLGSAIIDEDVDIHCKNLMSGMSIIIPENIKVDITGKFIMSGVTNNVPNVSDVTAPTIHFYTDNIMSGMKINVKDIESKEEEEEEEEEDDTPMK